MALRANIPGRGRFRPSVLQGWVTRAGLQTSRVDHVPEKDFRRLTRDLYIAAGEVGLCQGALRDPADDAHIPIADAAEQRQTITIELLYTDQVGGQRSISRFHLAPVGEDTWLASVGRHWYLDQEGPR